MFCIKKDMAVPKYQSQNIIYVDMKGKVDHPKDLGGGARMVVVLLSNK
ncbi:hypothetical protein [Photobacterium aquimaris]|nr:hypothetical protein [Photobacterium aquimaris]